MLKKGPGEEKVQEKPHAEAKIKKDLWRDLDLPDTRHQNSFFRTPRSPHAFVLTERLVQVAIILSSTRCYQRCKSLVSTASVKTFSRLELI